MLGLIVLASALAFSFVFSGAETGLYSINRLRLRSRTAIGHPGAASLSMLLKHPQRAINTVLTGNNITHYAATISCTLLLMELGATRRADFYSAAVLAPVMVVLTEMFPKVVFLRQSDALMYRLAPGLRVFQTLLMPVLRLLDAVHGLVWLTTGHRRQGMQCHMTQDRLRSMLIHGMEAGVLSPYQQTMADRCLSIKHRTLDGAFIPLDRVIMAPHTASRRDVLERFERHGFSRLPVFADGPERIIGLLNIADMLERSDVQDRITVMLHPAVYVDVDDSLMHALYLLQKAGQQMAVVRGRRNAAIGICTVKDLVEEIVGEIYEW